jgi:hypothetical protein
MLREEPVHTAPKYDNELRASRRHAAGWAAVLGLGTAGSAALLALGAMALAHCTEQPKPHCITAPLSFATRLIEKSRNENPPGACMGLGPGSFNADPEVGFMTYFPKDSKGQPNYDKPQLAVQTAELGALLAAAQAAGADNKAPDGKVYAWGDFSTAQAADNNFCTVPTLTPAHLQLDPIGMAAGVDITLTWSNVQVYLTAATAGTQVQGDLEDKRVTPTGTCTITYKAVALAPSVQCAATDADGGPIMNPDGTFQTNISACDPQPDPDAGRFLGSGIGPTTVYTCDPTIGWCTIQGDSVPALK